MAEYRPEILYEILLKDEIFSKTTLKYTDFMQDIKKIEIPLV